MEAWRAGREDARVLRLGSWPRPTTGGGGRYTTSREAARTRGVAYRGGPVGGGACGGGAGRRRVPERRPPQPRSSRQPLTRRGPAPIPARPPGASSQPRGPRLAPDSWLNRQSDARPGRTLCPGAARPGAHGSGECHGGAVETVGRGQLGDGARGAKRGDRGDPRGRGGNFQASAGSGGEEGLSANRGPRRRHPVYGPAACAPTAPCAGTA